MASPEKREFDKYVKFFTQKAVQIVVLSRQGNKIRSVSNPTATDWFNLALPDSREVVGELRRSVEPPVPLQSLPVNVEILVETPEGDSFVLETWTLAIDINKRDISVSVSHSLYPRLSLMLRSLLAVTRTTPAYQLSRRNEELNFTYRVFAGPVEHLLFSSGGKTFTFAQVSCPFGTLSLTVSYRTKFTPPERVLESAPATELTNQPVLESSCQEGSLQESSGRHRPLQMPFASVAPLQRDRQAQRSPPRHPFGAIMNHLPAQQQSDADSLPTEDCHGTTERQDSDDICSGVTTSGGHLTSACGQDGYVVLGVDETRPGFVSSPQPEQELNDLLRLCANPPSLELLSSPDAMDVGNASRFLEQQSHQESAVEVS